MTLDAAHFGRWVRYSDGHRVELGRIKGWNHKVIFVVYKCGGNWNRFMDYTGNATDPTDLTLMHEGYTPTPTLGSVNGRGEGA